MFSRQMHTSNVHGGCRCRHVTDESATAHTVASAEGADCSQWKYGAMEMLATKAAIDACRGVEYLTLTEVEQPAWVTWRSGMELV